MSLVEHYPPLIIPPEESYTNKRGHVTRPLEIPKMDQRLCDALDTIQSEEEIGPFDHALEKASVLRQLALETIDDPKRQKHYFDLAKAALNQAHDLLGYDAPLDRGDYELTA